MYLLVKVDCGKNIVLRIRAIAAKASLIKRLVFAVLKDVSLPLALSLADGRLSIRESKEIANVIFEAITRELLVEKLMVVEKEDTHAEE